nr:MAG TPA: hypothetical protein [Caudoviricetes sp.]
MPLVSDSHAWRAHCSPTIKIETIRRFNNT